MDDLVLTEPPAMQSPAWATRRSGRLRTHLDRGRRLWRRVASSNGSACVAAVVGLLLAVATASGW